MKTKNKELWRDPKVNMIHPASFLGAGLFADKIVKVNVRVKYPHYLGINFKDCRLEVCD